MLNRKSLPPTVREITDPLEAGVSVEMLASRFNYATINWALGALATLKPERYQALMGPPAAPQKILLDHCTGTGLLEITRQSFGHPLTVEFLSGKDADDLTVFYDARDIGAAAIFTRDGACRNRYDLCKIAKDAYRRHHKNEDPRLPPAVIVLPPGHEPSVALLTSRAAQIRTYIDNHARMLAQEIAHVMDLRKQKPALADVA